MGEFDTEPYFQSIQKACLPGIWSKGVALARDGAVIEDARKGGEWVFRLKLKDRPVSPRVSLWPGDDDSYCDCGDRAEPCAHIAAVVIALRSGLVKSREERAASSAPTLRYRFRRADGELRFERAIFIEGREEPLKESLVALIGGIQSGRVKLPPIAATQDDLAIDALITPGGARAEPRPGAETLRKLLARLENAPFVDLDGAPVRVSPRLVSVKARLRDEGSGYRLELTRDPAIQETFRNGAALVDGMLRPFEAPAIQERSFSAQETAWLVSEALPLLEEKFPIEIESKRLPEKVGLAPRVVIRSETLPGSETLSVVPLIVYGDPPIAEVHDGKLELKAGSTRCPKREPEAERVLARKIQSELHLSVGRVAKFEGTAAVELRRKLDGWDVVGAGSRAFEVAGRLTPRLDVSRSGFDVRFEWSEGGAPSRQAEAARVFSAWERGEAYVPLLGGGYAPLPLDWLAKYGATIRGLLAARDHGALPAAKLPEALALAGDLGEPVAPELEALKSALADFEAVPEAPLPEGLRAELRHYQRRGYDWLKFLHASGMGALLADDMGLGKTLQAICAMPASGRTLVVAPTSVLSSWQDQLARFRPGLKLTTYYGPNRALRGEGIVLTTYSILRLDRDALTAQEWDLAILDEAQTIKNPESQAARAAHAIRARARIALSGTPIENRLEDLWSQFQFLNPGLLGAREDFRDRAGDLGALRRRVRPFILRRLKKEVAPELPPRTEVVLHCELDEAEREAYDALMTATRDEVVRSLEEGASALTALEALLRLRQACCHPGLLPGASSERKNAASSKTRLFMETLAESIGLGHRALVFSQWTSFLDLLEPELASAGVGYLRLDGSTTDRGGVVSRFQALDGPPVMLISLKAGGTGLTLTAADHVFILDPWWNPAVEDQAADRAHRIGQESPVLIHRLVAKDTVEDRVLALQASKQALAGAVLSSGDAGRELTRDDLLALFDA